MRRRPGKESSTVESVSREVEGVERVGESRLAQWSRRKAEARRRKISVADPVVDEHKPVPLEDAPVDNQAITPPTDKDMPPLESLDEHSDYSAFLSPGVSEKLRKQALRKLFHLDVYNFSDGLDDYAEDYTNFAALGNIITSDMRLQQLRAESRTENQSLNQTGSPEDEPGEPPGEQTDDQPVFPGEESSANGVPETGEADDHDGQPGKDRV